MSMRRNKNITQLYEDDYGMNEATARIKINTLLTADSHPARRFQQAKEPEAMACGVKGGVRGRV